MSSSSEKDCNSQLCSYCHSLTLDAEIGRHDHHPSVQSLSQAASSGCPICSQIWENFISVSDEEHFFWKGLDWRFDLYQDPATIQYEFVFDWFEPQLEQAWSCKFYLRWITDPPIQEHMGDFHVNPVNFKDMNQFPIKEVHKSTSSTQSWGAASHWIQQCIESHPNCCQKITSSWLPTRVLDLGSNEEPHLCLRDTKNIIASSQYVSLSHCWGKHQIKQLLSTNKAEMYENIDFEELPKTFQDAIRFTRWCKVRYLWIDSLCIIQDSASDWIKESTLMNDVYQYAVCNIAATAASDGRMGCFLDRNQVLARPCRVRLSKFPGKMSNCDLYDLMPRQFWHHDIAAAPLNQRAWVLQEQFSSPRVIHCGKNQLFWECNQLVACEMYPNGLPIPTPKDIMIVFKQSELARRMRSSNKISNNQDKYPAQDEASEMAQILLRWSGLLTAYTRRSLTKRGDILIAIPAIASQFEALLNDKYVAGLWADDLPLQLLWIADAGLFPKDRDPFRSPSYDAPSWSWASVIGPIVHLNLKLNSLPLGRSFMIQILKTVVETSSDYHLGPVAAAHLTLCGWMKRAPKLKPRRRLMAGSLHIGDADFDDWEDPRNEDCYCVPIVVKEFLPGDESLSQKKNWRVAGLLLSVTEIPGVFQRVGIFESTRKGFDAFRRPRYPPHKPIIEIKQARVADQSENINGSDLVAEIEAFAAASETDMRDLFLPEESSNEESNDTESGNMSSEGDDESPRWEYSDDEESLDSEEDEQIMSSNWLDEEWEELIFTII